ncbi:MAG: Na+/H+ antiporter NhaC family protein [Bacteroidaceae bacterium]|nr:Na+/H+ antiporter NhaC family protein [Bacteroidaceae bacterium]
MGDFYAIPITVAFVLTCLYALFVLRKGSFSERLMQFARGAGNENIMYMILIFILAGAFASLAKGIGAIDATVELCLHFLPPSCLLPGLFLAACLVSISIGTSVGTIVALVPLAAGLATQTGSSVALYTACIVGGAFFGDNLSFISDTTIVATRSQGIDMQEKFLANIRIALPAAILSLAIYTIIGYGSAAGQDVAMPDLVLIIPYVVVLVTAAFGMNVIMVLTLGVALSVSIAAFYQSMTLAEMLKSMNEGIGGMSELIIVTMLAGGIMELVRINGGIDYLIGIINRHVRNRRWAEISIGFMTLAADFCTANNTIAILTVSPLAKDIATRFGIHPRRTASLMDTWSCFAQSVIPYGAQILMAAGLASIAPTQIIPNLIYPYILIVITIISSLFFVRLHKQKHSQCQHH